VTQTFANGYGVWHARVSRTAASPLLAARRAIRDELKARESSSAPVASRCWRDLVRAPIYDDAETIVYREAFAPDETQNATLEYFAHIARWAVIIDGVQVKSYKTRTAAQRYVNRVNGEITR
jgi:hypothetical protein